MTCIIGGQMLHPVKLLFVSQIDHFQSVGVVQQVTFDCVRWVSYFQIVVDSGCATQSISCPARSRSKERENGKTTNLIFCSLSFHLPQSYSSLPSSQSSSPSHRQDRGRHNVLLHRNWPGPHSVRKQKNKPKTRSFNQLFIFVQLQ